MHTMSLIALLAHPVQSLSELAMLAFIPATAALLGATLAAARTA